MKLTAFNRHILAKRRPDLTEALKARLGDPPDVPVGPSAEVFEIVEMPTTTPDEAAHRLDAGDLVLASTSNDLIGDLSIIDPARISAMVYPSADDSWWTRRP